MRFPDFSVLIPLRVCFPRRATTQGTQTLLFLIHHASASKSSASKSPSRVMKYSFGFQEAYHPNE